MTPKEQYEARKADRKKRLEGDSRGFNKTDIEVEEVVDRLATAFERIADALTGIEMNMRRND